MVILIYEYVITFIVGLMVGSFLNVCIYRIPVGKSVYSPNRSFCPTCGNTILWYDNIPILSYLILKRKCRYCKHIISIQYPLVELITGLFFLLLLYRFGISLTFFGACILVSILIAASVIDLQRYIIPNKLVFPGLIIGFALMIIAAAMKRQPLLLIPGIVGMLIGGAILYVLSIFGQAIFRKEAMGMGDVKLMAMMGLYLTTLPVLDITSWREMIFLYVPRMLKLLLVVLFSSAFMGSIIGGIMMLVRRKGRRNIIPYGPFLAAGAILALLYGNEIWAWYRGLLH